MEFKKIRQRIVKHSGRDFINSFKQLQGKPHYVSMGIAIGVFVSLTPSFPFQTPIAVALAFILKGSKRAAAIGVWLSNPLTLPFCYLASYKLGQILLGTSSPFVAETKSISDIVKLGIDVFYTMLTGGVLLGSASGVVAYFITLKAFTKRQTHNSTK